MAYELQMLRALIEAHPDRAVRLRPHIMALEASIASEPGLCLHRVRTLFEVVHETIAPQIGVDLTGIIEFPTRNSKIIKALDFSLPDHPDAERINTAIAKLLGSINGTAAALAELSNIPNLRHGGSLDWATLERQHAIMLGGLCDTLVSFLFDVAWNRPSTDDQSVEVLRFEDFPDFNDAFDEEHGTVQVAGSAYRSSQVLFHLDLTQYELAQREWSAALTEPEAGEVAA
jgi:hypothetical protein